jgi:hypothetical protein
MLVEDLLVIDAPTLYLAPSLLGHLVPQVMDGALLKPLLQEDGRTPLPPDPAYQQVLKGVPAVEYTLDEVVRMPRNLRSNRVYGMSPVEQVQMTASHRAAPRALPARVLHRRHRPRHALRRAEEWTPDADQPVPGVLGHAMSAGTPPSAAGCGSCPAEWTPFPLKGAAQGRPSTSGWRIICYCFDLSPQALVKQMNRATAETAKQTAQEEGLEPLKLWFKDTDRRVLRRPSTSPSWSSVSSDEEIGDPEVKANVSSTPGGGKPSSPRTRRASRSATTR